MKKAPPRRLYLVMLNVVFALGALRKKVPEPTK